MQTTSQTWHALLAAGAPLQARATIGGVAYTDISTPVITRALMQDRLSVGNVVSASLALAVRGAVNIPRSAAVVIEVRLNDGQTASEWLPQGTFYISRRMRDPVTGLLALECYDALLKANAVWTPSAGAWPRTMAAVTAELAALLGVTLDSRTVIPSGAACVMSEPAEGTTIRDALGVVAQAAGGNWAMTPAGLLRLVRVGESGDAVDVTGVVGGIDVGQAGTVTGVRSTVDGVVTLIGDDTGIVVDVSIAPMIAAEMAEDLIGQAYAPFHLSGAIYDPAAELGDGVRAGAGGEVISALCSEQAAYGPAFRGDIAAPDPGEVTDEYPYIGSAERTLALAKAAVTEAVDRLDDELTQQEIFNRLTDNGAAQGLVLYNGQLYVNASYIQTGTLVANLIKAGVLGDLAGKNYWNMETGEFSLSATTTVGGSTVEDIAQGEAEQAVEDFDDTLTQQDVFNRLTNNGAAQGIVLSNGQLYINASYIQSGTLVLGGANNQNGALRVLNASGQEIGTWTKDGISISEGKLNLSRTELGVTYSVKIWDNALYPIMVDYSDNNHDYRTTIGGITPLIVRNINDAHGFFVTPKSLSFIGQNGLPWFSVNKTDNTSGDDEYRLILGQYSVGDVLAEIYGDLKVRGDVSLFNPLSVGNGGTGATTAAGARANLEITPANIGAVAKTGDTMTGPLAATKICSSNSAYPAYEFQNAQGTVAGDIYYDISSKNYTFRCDPYGQEEHYALPTSTGSGGHYILTDKSPVTVPQGGTGATTPDGACANIGAVKKSGDTMTGPLTAQSISVKADLPMYYLRDENNLDYAHMRGDNTDHHIIFRMTTPGGNPQLFEDYSLPNPTIQSGPAGYDILTTKSAVGVPQGGTGATTPAQACANIGAVAKTGDTMTGQLTVPNMVVKSGSWQFYYMQDSNGAEVGHVRGDEAAHHIAFREITPGTNSAYEDYFLPNPTIQSGPVGYDILTTKSPVGIPQGGTGATDAPGARANLGIATTVTTVTTTGITSNGNWISDLNPNKVVIDAAYCTAGNVAVTPYCNSGGKWAFHCIDVSTGAAYGTAFDLTIRYHNIY